VQQIVPLTLRSEEAFARAKASLVGGVDSPVRAYGAVGGTPRFIAHGQGPRITDIDGNTYLDYVLSWGPLILGHADARVVAAVIEAAQRGMSFGAPCEAETELARLVQQRLPSMELLRFVSSGTEATMSALRLARGWTGRDIVIKFAGCYHGHGDAFLAAVTNAPQASGVPRGVAESTIVLPYNDLDAVREAFAEHGASIAAVIVEPYAGNMGMVMPLPGYLAGLREATAHAGSLLIFDEVMTGLRVDRGGAQIREAILPDLTTLAKVLGGGMPVGAFGGRADIMAYLAPSGPVYQGGTLSGNPVAMAAGIATLRALDTPGLYERLDAMAARLLEGMEQAAHRAGLPFVGVHAGGMFGFAFSRRPIIDYATAQAADTEQYTRFFHAMLARGVMFAPSPFEASFLSTLHDEAIIDTTIAAAAEVFEQRA